MSSPPPNRLHRGDGRLSDPTDIAARHRGHRAQLKASVGSGSLRVRLLDPAQRPEAAGFLERELGPVILEPDPAALSSSCSDADRAAAAVAGLAGTGVRIAAFSLGQPSLDEVFLALTGHPAEPAPAEKSEDVDEDRAV